ncbi:MAG: 6-bladed beta-propeller [Candidatus Aminicenantes bacterium]|jgi:hypothetical protein
MKKSFLLCIFVSLILVSFLLSEVKNPDKPLKGQWDFKLEPVWKTDKAGEQLLAKPYHIMASEDQTIYLYDIKNLKYFIFSKEGKLIKSFGTKGEGPGEIVLFRDAFLVNDKLILVDINEIDYFTKDGTYIKSVKNSWSQRKPDYFFNEDEFIYYPFSTERDPNIEGKIFRYNFKTKEKIALAEFPLFEGGYAAGEKEDDGIAMVLIGLSPMMVVGYDTDRCYFGYNNTFDIHIADYDGKKLGSFSLDREIRKISNKEKKEWFKKNPPPSPIPDDMLQRIAKSLPNTITYFTRMEVYHKLLYVFTGYLNRQPRQQQIDIFSPQGKYLYRAFIRAPEKHNIFSGPIPILTIKGDHLYIVLEDKQGEVWLCKYKITLPTS